MRRRPWIFVGWIAAGLVLAAAAWLGLFYFQVGVPVPYEQGWIEYSAKKEAAARDSGTPKLVIAGGSTTFMGISAEQIHRATGVPTVNFGLRGAFGPDYTLGRLKPLLQPGDIVLLAFEYSSHFRDGRPNLNLMSFMLAGDPAHFLSLPLLTQLEVAFRLPPRRILLGVAFRVPGLRQLARLSQANSWVPLGTWSKLVNAHGDHLGTDPANLDARGLLVRAEAAARAIAPSDHEAGFGEIAAFIDWARANGVRVIATWQQLTAHPAYRQDRFRRKLEQMRGFYRTQNVELIGDPYDVMYPANLFLDSAAHLNRIGIERRTGELLPLLRPHIRHLAGGADGRGPGPDLGS